MKTSALKICLGIICIAVVITFFIALAMQSQFGGEIKNKTNELGDSINNGVSDTINAITPQAADENTNNNNNTAKSNSTATTDNKSYIVKTYGNGIGVFLEGENTPLKILETDLRTLPRSDAENISQGVKIIGDTNLKYFLRDFEN